VSHWVPPSLIPGNLNGKMPVLMRPETEASVLSAKYSAIVEISRTRFSDRGSDVRSFKISWI
jgi:hypothetical protein